ncbi:MAG: hypothetical protein HQM00_02530 [Magnetococcales bacterium]|nr:hypothetical protein [Magnetococcales bacterium]
MIIRRLKQEETLLLDEARKAGERLEDGVEVLWNRYGLEEPDSLRVGLESVAQAYARQMSRLTRGYAATHPLVRELLRALALSEVWSQGARNRLLVARLAVETGFGRLASALVDDGSRVLRAATTGRGFGRERVGRRLGVVASRLSGAGSRALLDGRMVQVRMLLRLMGEAERRVYFWYAGACGAESRPFCVERAGRVFDLGEVLSWERMRWSGRVEEGSVFDHCGGAGCGHLLLPITVEGVGRGRIFSRVAGRGAELRSFRGVANAAGPERFWNPDGEIGRWHEAAFGRAPDLVRRVVGLAGVPAGGIRNTPGRRRMMFAFERGVPHIEMGGIVYRSRLLRLEKLVWRHEFGHYLDYWLHGFTGNPLSFADREMRRAVRLDGSAIGIRAGLTGSVETRRRIVMTTQRLLHELLEHSASLSCRERAGWMDEALRGFGLTLNQVEAALEEDALYRGFGEDPVRMVMLLTALRRRDPFLFGEHVLEWRRRRHQELGMALIVADLFGALTGNVVGQGHADEYYLASPARRGGEAFANAWVMLGDGNRFWSRLLRIMAPRFTVCLMNALRAAAQAGEAVSVPESRSQAAR